MSLKTFKFALVAVLGLALVAPSMAAPIVTMSASPGQVRTNATGAGTYDIYDFLYSSGAGAEFSSYRIVAEATSGNLADPTRVQDSRQTTSTANGSTSGAIDTYANTVMTAAAAEDGGYTATISADPSFYAPTGAGAAPLYTKLDWTVFDLNLGDDNDLNDHPDGPFDAVAPYLLFRLAVTPNAAGTVNLFVNDSESGANATPFVFNFGAPPPDNFAPVVDDEPAVGGIAQGTIVATQFTATDETALPVSFSNAVLSSSVLLHPSAVNPAFNGSVDAAGNFTWDTTGWARGTYEIDVTATDSGSPALAGTGGNFLVTITTVPEPTTLSLFGLAMVGAMGFIRRRNG